MAVASAASSWLCHEGERSQAWRLPGPRLGERSGAQTGGERKGLEQRGLPRPASPPRHRLQQPEPQGASASQTSEGREGRRGPG